MAIVINVQTKAQAERFAKRICRGKYGACGTIVQWSRGVFAKEVDEYTKIIFDSHVKFWLVLNSELDNVHLLKRLEDKNWLR